MRQNIEGICPGCGQFFSIASAGSEGVYACDCGQSVRVSPHDTSRLKSVDVSQETRSSSSARWHLPSASGRHPAMEVSPTTAMFLRRAENDPRMMLLAQARMVLRKRGWTCQDWPGQMAFAAEVVVPGRTRQERDEALNVSVYSLDGVVCFETAVAPLPRPPWMPVRELLNRMNLRSGGSVFLLRECGIVARHKLLVRRSQVNTTTVMYALRQLNHDRRCAMPLLAQELIQAGVATSETVDRAFAAPSVIPLLTPFSQRQLQQLCQIGGYACALENGRMYLTPGRRSVWLSFHQGLLRGWAAPGMELDRRFSGERWGFLQKVMGHIGTTPPKLSRAQLDNLLERLNAMNESSGMLTYVWNGTQVLAMAVFPPSDKRMEIEDFRFIGEALLRRAREAFDGEALLSKAV